MQMVYNSENYAVVHFEMPDAQGAGHGEAAPAAPPGGFEIVDKFARKEIFIDGAMAASFKLGVEALIETSPSEEAFDEYLARYVALMHQPLTVH